MKKPVGKVVGLRGPHEPGTVTQQDLRELESLQQMEWATGKRAALLSEQIKTRLKGGSKLEDGLLYFDEQLEMVRSRKREGAG